MKKDDFKYSKGYVAFIDVNGKLFSIDFGN